jgi:hypothetical protein
VAKMMANDGKKKKKNALGIFGGICSPFKPPIPAQKEGKGNNSFQ